MKDELAFRQVHLDFHTSEAIPGIGKDWDKAAFQAALKLGHVSSITVFSKCHHGWSYHPTSVPLSQTHPHLKFDLLDAMLTAAHEIGVRAPVYLSAGLDEKLVRSHSQWLFRRADGSTSWVGWTEAGYHKFCFRSPYLDYFIEQVEEVVRRYDVDGLFLDIVGIDDCHCQYCLQALALRGEDVSDAVARARLARETYLEYGRRVNAAIQAIKPGMRVFHNGGHIALGDREALAMHSHLELESLPTGGWGYDHFPLSARYVQGLQPEFLGMTGKFHTMWGEFGGFKHPNALRFECALALSNGAKLSVGDQMHPYGRLDPATYALIGQAYAEVEAKEPWCRAVRSLAEVAVLSSESFHGFVPGSGPPTAGVVDAGVVRVMQEEHLLYDIVDAQCDFSPYKVLVLPDEIPVDLALADKITAFRKGGGKILVSGSSALDLKAGRFVLELGVRYLGSSPTNPSYLVPHEPLPSWQFSSFVIYSAMHTIEVKGVVLAHREDAFFNREFKHFTSHQHAPSRQVDAGPAIVATADSAYLAFPAFRLYAEKGQVALRQIIAQALKKLLPEPCLQTSLPSQGIVSAQRQDSERRTVLHLLYGVPVKRGKDIEVIEDLVPMHNVKVRFRADKKVSKVVLQPQGQPLEFSADGGWVNTKIPRLDCHQMLVLEDA